MPKLERWALDTEEQLEKAGGGRRRQEKAGEGRRKEEKGGERRKNKKEEQEGRTRKKKSQDKEEVAGQGRIGQFKGRKEKCFKGKKHKIQRSFQKYQHRSAMHNREVQIVTDAYRTKESNALRTCCNRSGGQCCLLRRVSNNIHSTPASTALLANMAPVAGQGGQGGQGGQQG